MWPRPSPVPSVSSWPWIWRLTWTSSCRPTSMRLEGWPTRPDFTIQKARDNGQFGVIYPQKLWVFHSYVNIYQTVYLETLSLRKVIIHERVKKTLVDYRGLDSPICCGFPQFTISNDHTVEWNRGVLNRALVIFWFLHGKPIFLAILPASTWGIHGGVVCFHKQFQEYILWSVVRFVINSP